MYVYMVEWLAGRGSRPELRNLVTKASCSSRVAFLCVNGFLLDRFVGDQGQAQPARGGCGMVGLIAQVDIDNLHAWLPDLVSNAQVSTALKRFRFIRAFCQFLSSNNKFARNTRACADGPSDSSS